jgi:hypothetical protein
MPEIGLGIGTGVGNFQGITREWLYWYDKQGKRYLTPEESQQQEQEARQQAEAQRLQEQKARLLAEQERDQIKLQAEKLATRLRELGIDPDKLD